jgi:hypothetical protein
MIEQRPSGNDARRPQLDEARLRQQAIGVKLRQMFDEVVNEPSPTNSWRSCGAPTQSPGGEGLR